MKAHYVREANLEIGRMRMRQLNLIEQFEQEERWLSLNLNERQNLLDRYVRGLFNSTTGEWEEYRHPDFYSIWVLHQLLYVVVQKKWLLGMGLLHPLQRLRPGPWDAPVRRHVCMRTGVVRGRLRQKVRLLHLLVRDFRGGVRLQRRPHQHGAGRPFAHYRRGVLAQGPRQMPPGRFMRLRDG